MTSANGADYARFIFKIGPGLTSYLRNMYRCTWPTEPKLPKKKRIACSSWASALNEKSGADFHDIMGEPDDQDDKGRVSGLEILLVTANEEANKKQLWNEIYQDSQYRMGVKIGEHEREIKRLQEENDSLRQTSLGKMTTILVKDLQDNEVCVPLC